MINLLVLTLFSFVLGRKNYHVTQPLPLKQVPRSNYYEATGDYWCPQTEIYMCHGGDRIGGAIKGIEGPVECKELCDEKAEDGCNCAIHNNIQNQCELFANVPSLKKMPEPYNGPDLAHRSVYAKMCPIRVITKCQQGRGRSDKQEYLTRVDSMEECVTYVIKNRPDANGATYKAGARKCWAETGQQDVAWGGTSDRYRNCEILSKDGDEPQEICHDEAVVIPTMAYTSIQQSNVFLHGLSAFGFAVVVYGAGKHFLGKN